MKIGRHLMVTDAQRVELRRGYSAGETVLGITHKLGQRSSSNIYRVLEATGVIPGIVRDVDDAVTAIAALRRGQLSARLG
jgi:hypothetical protein